MTVIEFAVPTAEVLNSNHRHHFRKQAKLTKALRTQGREAAEQQGFERLDRAHIYCHLSFGDKRRRDALNFWPSVKACVDGFVDAGLLPDDDHMHLDGPDIRIGPKRDVGLVWFTFQVSAA